MFIAQDEAEAIAKRVLAMSSAEVCRVWLHGSEGRNIRLASRGGTSNATRGFTNVTVTSNFGRKRGRAVAYALDEESLRDAVKRSEEAARLSPDNPETVPPLAQPAYPQSAAYVEATAALRMAELSELAAPAAELARKAQLDFALYTYGARSWRCYANSAGALGYGRATHVSLKMTTRNRRGTWSGWGGAIQNDVARLNPAELAAASVEKARATPDPMALDPGKYVVLLEPAVTGQFVAEMMWRFGAREADEGRSFLSKPGGGNRLGERVLGENVTVTSDPADRLAPGHAFGEDGRPHLPTTWVEKGVVKEMSRTAFWARKTSGRSLAPHGYYTMQGGGAATADMIRDVKRGVLVTRLWYVRTVDPRTVLVTGLTRDGTFLIENGAVTRPVNNFRFNESPVAVFNNVLAMGPPKRTLLAESEQALAVPTLLVKDFTFTSISPAV